MQKQRTYPEDLLHDLLALIVLETLQVTKHRFQPWFHLGSGQCTLIWYIWRQLGYPYLLFGKLRMDLHLSITSLLRYHACTTYFLHAVQHVPCVRLITVVRDDVNLIEILRVSFVKLLQPLRFSVRASKGCGRREVFGGGVGLWEESGQLSPCHIWSDLPGQVFPGVVWLIEQGEITGRVSLQHCKCGLDIEIVHNLQSISHGLVRNVTVATDHVYLSLCDIQQAVTASMTGFPTSLNGCESLSLAML